MDYGTVGYDSSSPAAVTTSNANIRNAATWDGYHRDLVRDVIRSKKGGSESVPGGKRVGLVDLSQDAHPFIPIEWWSKHAKLVFPHLATCSVFEHVAERFNLHLFPVSKETLALSYELLGSGGIDEEYKPQEGEKGFGAHSTFMDDVDKEGERSEADDAADEDDRETVDVARSSIKAILKLREDKAAESSKPSAKGSSAAKTGGGADQDGDDAAILDRLHEKVRVAEASIKGRSGSGTPAPRGGLPRGAPTRPAATVLRREKLGPEPEKATPKTAKDRAALLRLRAAIEGATYLQSVDLEHTTAELYPAGRADISDMPVGILTDVAMRQQADAAVVDIIANSFRDVDGGVAAGLTEKLRDATCLKVLGSASLKNDMSPLDLLFNLTPAASMLMVSVNRGYVAPTITERARKFRAMVESLTFIGAEGQLDVATPHTLLQTGLSESGSGPKDNDWNKLTKEVLAALSDSVDKNFVGVDQDGDPLDWAQTVQAEIDRHSEQKHGDYHQPDFRRLTNTIARYGLAQIRRTEAVTGLRQLRAKGGADQVNMLGAGWGGSDPTWGPGQGESGAWGDDGASAWGRFPSYLTADEDRRVLYLGSNKCLEPSCGASLSPHFATCMECGSFQDKVWRCGKCNLFTRGDFARCRYGLTSGCPGTREEGRTATQEEYVAAADVMARAKEERASRGPPSPAPLAIGWGKGGKAKGGGKGGGGGAGKGFAARPSARVAVMEAVERGMASGDTDRLVQEVRRAHQGC